MTDFRHVALDACVDEMCPIRPTRTIFISVRFASRQRTKAHRLWVRFEMGLCFIFNDCKGFKH